ncbi:hypothetical protein Tco_0861855, partial [Tanacetum coccineum]
MGEPLSPDRVFDFPMDEPEPHPLMDFSRRPLLGYAGNPNNANRWIEAYVPLLGEIGEPLGAEVIAPVIDVDEDLAMLFGDDNFSDDDSDGFEDEEKVWEVNEELSTCNGWPKPSRDLVEIIPKKLVHLASQ